MSREAVTLQIPAIHCDGCLRTVQKAVEGVGATFESGDAEAKQVTLHFDNGRLSREELLAALEAIGFPPETAD